MHPAWRGNKRRQSRRQCSPLIGSHRPQYGPRMSPENSIPFPLLIVVGVGAIILLIVVFRILEKKRTAALEALAQNLGIPFSPGPHPALLPKYEHIGGLKNGDNRRTENVFAGTYRDHAVTAFEYHYTTDSRDSDGRRETDTHYRHAIILDLGRSFPPLTIVPEDLLSKIAQAFGNEDIDFDSPDFSRRYCVRSPDRNFASAFCGPAVIELLLSRPGTRLEVADRSLAFVAEGRFQPDALAGKIDFSIELRSRLPSELFARA